MNVELTGAGKLRFDFLFLLYHALFFLHSFYFFFFYSLFYLSFSTFNTLAPASLLKMTRMNLSILFTPYGGPVFEDESVPTYIAIVNKKDGTTTTKCLNPSSRTSSASVSTRPLKKRLISPSSFLPKFRLQAGVYGRRRSSVNSKLSDSSDSHKGKLFKQLTQI